MIILQCSAFLENHVQERLLMCFEKMHILGIGEYYSSYSVIKQCFWKIFVSVGLSDEDVGVGRMDTEQDIGVVIHHFPPLPSNIFTQIYL